MIKYTAKNYKQFDLSSFHHKDTIVYLDPPYEGAAEYKKGQTEQFDYDEFWEWFNTHNLPMLASSYDARPYIHKLTDIKKRILLSGSQNNISKEKLFANKRYIELFIN